MYNKLGPDTGYDCISNFAPADQLTNILDAINENGGLPKNNFCTVLNSWG